MYSITGPTGKKYIGITIRDGKHRLKSHLYSVKRGVDTPLYRSIRKHGWENFAFEVLFMSDDWDYLCLTEKLAIARFCTFFPYGYNLTTGGEGIIGRADISKEKASKSLREAWLRDDGSRRNDRRGVRAMRFALINDPDLELTRRSKISDTMKERGIGKGSSNGFSKLTEEDVESIRNALRAKERDTFIARQFNVSRRLINFIRLGHRWNDGSIYPKPLPRTVDDEIRKRISEGTKIGQQRSKLRKSEKRYEPLPIGFLESFLDDDDQS